MTSEPKVTATQRHQMIAEAAYFRAERRGFDSDPVADWCEAEVEVDARVQQIEDEHLLGRAEEVLAAASKQLTAVKRKLTSLSAEARAEWQQELDKLAKLRQSLEPKLAELREQGQRAGQRLRQQVATLRDELAEFVQRVGSKRP